MLIVIANQGYTDLIMDAARAEGAAYVVVMGHLGNEDSCAPWTYADVIANTTGIDALLDGHSHDTDQVEMLNKDGETVLRSGCGTKLAGVGCLRIGKDGKLSTDLFLWNNKTAAPDLLCIRNDSYTAVKAAKDGLPSGLRSDL